MIHSQLSTLNHIAGQKDKLMMTCRDKNPWLFENRKAFLSNIWPCIVPSIDTIEWIRKPIVIVGFSIPVVVIHIDIGINVAHCLKIGSTINQWEGHIKNQPFSLSLHPWTSQHPPYWANMLTVGLVNLPVASCHTPLCPIAWDCCCHQWKSANQEWAEAPNPSDKNMQDIHFQVATFENHFSKLLECVAQHNEQSPNKYQRQWRIACKGMESMAPEKR